MKTFAQFRDEVEGYEDVRKTVEAEEKISIANVHLFLREARKLRDYTQALEGILSRFLYSVGKNPELIGGHGKKKTLLVFGGNKGLVGGLWNRLVDYLTVQLESYHEVMVYGEDVAKRLDLIVSRKFRSKTRLYFFAFPPQGKIPLFQTDLLKFFQEGSFSKIDIVWPKMVAFSFFQPFKKTIIPFDLKADIQSSNTKNNSAWPIFEPNGKKIFEELADKYLFSVIRRIIIETKLAESLSRATSMEKAKGEVDKLIKQITHVFRVKRRKILTKSQIEVFVAHKISKML